MSSFSNRGYGNLLVSDWRNRYGNTVMSHVEDSTDRLLIKPARTQTGTGSFWTHHTKDTPKPGVATV